MYNRHPFLHIPHRSLFMINNRNWNCCKRQELELTRLLCKLPVHIRWLHPLGTENWFDMIPLKKETSFFVIQKRFPWEKKRWRIEWLVFQKFHGIFHSFVSKVNLCVKFYLCERFSERFYSVRGFSERMSCDMYDNEIYVSVWHTWQCTSGHACWKTYISFQLDRGNEYSSEHVTMCM